MSEWRGRTVRQKNVFLSVRTRRHGRVRVFKFALTCFRVLVCRSGVGCHLHVLGIQVGTSWYLVPPALHCAQVLDGVSGRHGVGVPFAAGQSEVVLVGRVCELVGVRRVAGLQSAHESCGQLGLGPDGAVPLQRDEPRGFRNVSRK